MLQRDLRSDVRKVGADASAVSIQHVAFQASAFAVKDGLAMFDVARYVGLRGRAPHGADKHHDPPNIVIGEAAGKGRHGCSADPSLDGFENRVLTKTEKSAIADQGRSALTLPAIDTVTGSAGADVESMSGGNHLWTFTERILYLRGLTGSNGDCPEE